MISHTRVLNLKTGRPFEEVNRHTMENSHPAEAVSVDYLAEYISFALRVLKNADLPCEGFTTPGGFGNMVKSELSLAAIDALRSTYKVEVPHYFKYVETGEEDGFKIFQKAVTRVNEGYGDRVAWMKLSEIARYWAAKELTSIVKTEAAVELDAPFATPDYALRFKMASPRVPKVVVRPKDPPLQLHEAKSAATLKAGTWRREGEQVVVCFDLPKGVTRVL